ncbi:MAG: hypothetical protein LBK52_03260 [Deltaproteobacteria bacterium]|jgi:hypothetical protein|nr:hypothetical protein [Deltaproteobacteria bacterium]
MSDNASSAELITSNGLAHSKMASATDRHLGGLRQEMVQKADSHIQFTEEKNMREAAGLEIGRSRILSRIV